MAELTDDYIGKLAILKIGFAKGLVGVIKKNDMGVGVSPYYHEAADIRTGISFTTDVEIIGEELER